MDEPSLGYKHGMHRGRQKRKQRQERNIEVVVGGKFRIRFGGPVTGLDATKTRHVGHPGEQLRLMAKIARMYHLRGMRQNEIAAELHLSQARVSRLLKRAAEVGIVRTTVTAPPGVQTELEEELEQRFHLQEAVVVNVGGEEEAVIPAIGAAAAVYLENTLMGAEVVGISTWSANLLATVESMRPANSRVVEKVVQLMDSKIGRAHV